MVEVVPKHEAEDTKVAKSKAVVTRTPTFMDEAPDYVNQESVRGSEAVGVDDITIPRVDVLQDLSPQVKKSKPEYIEGAEPGLLFNTVTGKLYGGELIIVPVLFRKEYVIWKDRDSGGGFRGAFSTEEAANAALARLEDSKQCEVVDTAQHFVLIIDSDGAVDEAVLSMSKSKMKCSRQLNTLIRMSGGDRWARAYNLTPIAVDGQKGDYYNMMVKQLGYVPKDIFDRAEEMYESVKAGRKDVDRSVPESGAMEDQD